MIKKKFFFLFFSFFFFFFFLFNEAVNNSEYAELNASVIGK